MLSLIAVASMLAGNLLALLQDNVKRLLPYSSIAHLGYLLVAILACCELAVDAGTFYLVVYFVANLGAFGVVGEAVGLPSAPQVPEGFATRDRLVTSNGVLGYPV